MAVIAKKVEGYCIAEPNFAYGSYRRAECWVFRSMPKHNKTNNRHLTMTSDTDSVAFGAA